MSKVGQSILKGAEEALAIAQGTAKQGTYRVHVPATVDVRAIRRKLGLSQSAFAARFGFSPRTIQEWEQGRRQPEGAARAFLAVIGYAPDVVNKALSIA